MYWWYLHLFISLKLIFNLLNSLLIISNNIFLFRSSLKSIQFLLLFILSFIYFLYFLRDQWFSNLNNFLFFLFLYLIYWFLTFFPYIIHLFSHFFFSLLLKRCLDEQLRFVVAHHWAFACVQGSAWCWGVCDFRKEVFNVEAAFIWLATYMTEVMLCFRTDVRNALWFVHLKLFDSCHCFFFRRKEAFRSWLGCFSCFYIVSSGC